MKIMIEEWDGDGAIRIPAEALQESELDVGDSLYLIEQFVGSKRCLVLPNRRSNACVEWTPFCRGRHDRERSHPIKTFHGSSRY